MSRPQKAREVVLVFCGSEGKFLKGEWRKGILPQFTSYVDEAAWFSLEDARAIVEEAPAGMSLRVSQLSDMSGAVRAADLDGTPEAARTAIAKSYGTIAESVAESAPGGRIRDPYLLWSNRHQMWWARRESSYTPDFIEAGYYTPERAVEVCAKSALGWDRLKDDVPPTVAVRVAAIPVVSSDEERRALVAEISARTARNDQAWRAWRVQIGAEQAAADAALERFLEGGVFDEEQDRLALERVQYVAAVDDDAAVRSAYAAESGAE